jgi:hypothetical protein
VLDLLFVALVVAFFVLAVLVVRGCAAIVGEPAPLDGEPGA